MKLFRKKEPTLNKRFPLKSFFVLAVIFVICTGANLIAPYSPGDMDSSAINAAPYAQHIFGTDSLGRDVFSMILYGGRVSIYIGIFATVITTVIAVVLGCVSGIAGEKVDDLIMRFTELVMSIPSIMLVIFIQALWRNPSATTIAVTIGITSWMNMAKVVRSEVRQIGRSDYILAAETMGGGFFYIMRRHLVPNFISSIMFMIVTCIGQAIATEATLSFLGLGLPLTVTSWGSLMSLSEGVLLSSCWWIIIIPGVFLVATLVCITEIGEYIRRENNRLYSNL